MNNKKNKSQKIDFLGLSNSEKAKLIRTAKKVLRRRIEEAKLWRILLESDGILAKSTCRYLNAYNRVSTW